ncbi:unnamed protein product [Sphagnum jensenii]|uniref:Uncharacterized protein n=1 Tax=Sphagnum jensenii TaxID=128206 RepID=A0ABP1ALP1_9BRYO
MMPTTGITMRRTEEMTQNARLSRSGNGLAPAEASVVLRSSLTGFPTTPLMNSLGWRWCNLRQESALLILPHGRRIRHQAQSSLHAAELLGDVAVVEPHRRDRQLRSAKFLQTTQKQFRSAQTNCANRITCG